MIQAVNFSDFCAAFHAHDRDDQFSYVGKRALFDYLEELGEHGGEQIELDVIALCCDYIEMPVDDIVDDYSITLDDDSDDDDKLEQVLDYLNDKTAVIGETNPGVILFANF